MTGRDKRVFKFMIKQLDLATKIVREGQEKGKNVSLLSTNS